MKTLKTLTIITLVILFSKTAEAQIDAPIRSEAKLSLASLYIQDSLNFNEITKKTTAERINYISASLNEVIFDTELQQYFIYRSSNGWIRVQPNALQLCLLQMEKMREQLQILEQQVAKLQEQVNQK